jgi:hypothetical protein
VTTLSTDPDRRRDPEMRLAEAARLIPSSRGDRQTHPATLTRWILRGVRLRNGQTLKLAARRYPGGWSVTRQALDDFVSALTADRCGAPPPAAIEPPAARRKAHDRAEAGLDAIGI